MTHQLLEKPAHILEDVLMDESLTPREVERAAAIFHKLHEGHSAENLRKAHDQLLELLGNVRGSRAEHSIREGLVSIEEVLAEHEDLQ